ncbi:chloride channel protein [Arhodomonas aquaeolei]|uniref:chloride channel protein n=1 Tax=Arhodomonas aquaeolei TaxID=2369 RepID=UPI00216947C4|nr:chloride channel protein [Arhodomonas aquaeolei]MCS4504533.1 chloride channel protein [Arhodomonas aquaeolei]
MNELLLGLRRSKRNLLSPLLWRVRIVFWLASIVVGLAGVAFAMGADYAQGIHNRLMDLSPWATLIITPLGIGALVWFTERFIPAASGSGIPQVIVALQGRTGDPVRQRVLSPVVGVAKIVVTMFGLMLGASIGREGPTIHVGAAVMHLAGRIGRFPSHYLEKGLILAGGAAGLSAAFNTPLAGVVFAIEELHRDYEEGTSGLVLLSVILAGLTSLVVIGDYAYFGHISTTMPQDWSWVAVPVCGLVGGLAGGLFSWTLQVGVRGLGPIRRGWPLLFGLGCGLVIALIGIAAGGRTFGTGYEQAKHLLDAGSMAEPGAMLSTPLLAIGKWLATVVSYLSGIPGGLFSPSLSAGAELGAALTGVLPYAPAGVVILLGMTAYFSGVVQTPITTFVIVLEMTDNNAMLVPLMATSVIAFGVSRAICPYPVYHALAKTFIGRREDA